MYLGSWAIDNLLTFTVTTHSPTTGAETDPDSAPTYRVYEDETGTAILTGTMAKLDDANTVGYYSEQITLSAANGFEKGKSYNIHISAVVGGVTGSTDRSLQIEAEVDSNTVSGAATLTSGERNSIADSILARSWASTLTAIGGIGSLAQDTVLRALFMIRYGFRPKIGEAGVIEVLDPSGNASHEMDVVTDASAEPVTEVTAG